MERFQVTFLFAGFIKKYRLRVRPEKYRQRTIRREAGKQKETGSGVGDLGYLNEENACQDFREISGRLKGCGNP